jgi:hypothetical protein
MPIITEWISQGVTRVRMRSLNSDGDCQAGSGMIIVKRLWLQRLGPSQFAISDKEQGAEASKQRSKSNPIIEMLLIAQVADQPEG